MRMVYVFVAGIALLLLVALGFLGYQAFLAPEAPTPTPTAQPPETVPVNAEGRVVPVQDAQLAFALAGRVERVMVLAGDQVEAGDLLLELEHDSLQAQIDQAQAAMAAAEAQQDLLPSRASDEEEDLAQAMVDQAQAALQAARLQLDQASLRAPFGGQVISVEVKAGEVVGAGVPALVLADTSRWLVETLDVLEEDAVRLRLGQETAVTFAAYPDHELSGTVERVAFNASTYRGNVTYTVTVSLPQDPGLDLQWGMTAFVEIVPLASGGSTGTTATPRPAATTAGDEPVPTDGLAATPSPTPTHTPSASPTASATARTTVHIVADGETLFRIALRYGVTVEALKEANDLDDNLIYVGQRLEIPLP
jgi:RND family efflux transporter MFP subunit